MRCIPRDTFEFYNEPGTQNISSIQLNFEQCGGKYAQEKDFDYEIAAEREAALASGEEFEEEKANE